MVIDTHDAFPAPSLHQLQTWAHGHDWTVELDGEHLVLSRPTHTPETVILSLRGLAGGPAPIDEADEAALAELFEEGLARLSILVARPASVIMRELLMLPAA